MLTQPQADALRQIATAYAEDYGYWSRCSQTGTAEEEADALAMLRVTRAKLDRMLVDLTLVRVEKKP